MHSLCSMPFHTAAIMKYEVNAWSILATVWIKIHTTYRMHQYTAYFTAFALSSYVMLVWLESNKDDVLFCSLTSLMNGSQKFMATVCSKAMILLLPGLRWMRSSKSKATVSCKTGFCFSQFFKNENKHGGQNVWLLFVIRYWLCSCQLFDDL